MKINPFVDLDPLFVSFGILCYTGAWSSSGVYRTRQSKVKLACLLGWKDLAQRYLGEKELD